MALTIPQAVRKLLIREPFYGLFLMSLNKYYSDKVPTLCVTRNGINTDLVINKQYWESLSDDLQISALQHEVNHIVFKHLFMQQDFPNKKHFNIAADCEVNSYITPLHPDWIEATKYNLPNTMGTKFYYENIPEEEDDPPQDEHNWDGFQGITDAEKQLISNQIDHVSKQTAEQVQKQNGRIPACFEDYIGKLFKKKERIFNWKAYFRRMIGTIQDIELKKTRKRESIRFPDASGLKHKRKSNICVIVDTSGSVSDKELCEFFSEIHHVWKAGASVTIVENDAAIGRIYKYEGKWDGKCTGRGGKIVPPSIAIY